MTASQPPKGSSAAMQSDLNRVHKKPQYRELKGEGSEQAQADEAWDNARSWSSSVVQDVFEGQLKSTLHCPKCDKESHRFDCFHDISLPLPKTGRASCTIEVSISAVMHAVTACNYSWRLSDA